MAICDKDGAFNGSFAMFTDITERKLTEGDLRESQATLRTVLQAVPIGIGLARNRIFDWINERLSLMTGYSTADLMGAKRQDSLREW